PPRTHCDRTPRYSSTEYGTADAVRASGPSGKLPIGMPLYVSSQVPAHTAVTTTACSPIVSGLHATAGTSYQPHDAVFTTVPLGPRISHPTCTTSTDPAAIHPWSAASAATVPGSSHQSHESRPVRPPMSVDGLRAGCRVSA